MDIDFVGALAFAETVQETVAPDFHWYVTKVNSKPIVNGESHPIEQGTSYFSLELQDRRRKPYRAKDYDHVPALKTLNCVIKRADGRDPAETPKLQVAFGENLGSVSVKFNKAGTYDMQMTGRAFKLEVKPPVARPEPVVIAPPQQHLSRDPNRLGFPRDSST